MLRIYNSLSRTIEKVTFSNNTCTIYVCGITPYDTTHLGHAFTYVTFDTFIRFLRWKKISVRYTQNVTDIDDPLFERARKVGRDWKTLGNTWTARYLSDMAFLHVAQPNHFVKVTQEIDQIITIIKVIIAKDLAYAREGYVYFDVVKDKEYGKLSRLTPSEMTIISRERGNDPRDPRKKNPLDFILWQPSKEDEPSWPGPFGDGRPGWHIECSAMSMKYLGKQIDIHGGGRDLIFPHHESEIAQSESYTDIKPFVRYWMHTAMVQHEGKKMSKSLGNLVLVDKLRHKHSAGAIRWYLLNHHYRKEWNFDEKELTRAEEEVKQIRTLTADNANNDRKGDMSTMDAFVAALDNDFDTPTAQQIIIDTAKQSVGEKNNPLLARMMHILGIPV